MTPLLLRLRLPQTTPGEAMQLESHVLNSNVYSMATAQALVNYAIEHKASVVFQLMDGSSLPFNPLDYHHKVPTLGGGAISLMYDEELDVE